MAGCRLAITWQVVGYLRYMICYELALEMRYVITCLGSDLMKC